MERLIALVNIQYKGKLYIPGEEIPKYTLEMADAWKRAESVKVLDEVNKGSSEESTGLGLGDDKPGVNEGENVGDAADENADKKLSDEEPDNKEPVKEGRKKK